MVQFECPRVRNPLVSFTFGVHCGVSISQYAGKGRCCMWPVNKVEIHIAKTGFVDCKWSNLNALGSINPWCYSLLGYIEGCPFHSMQEKGSAASGLWIKWKFILQKQVSWTAKNPTWMPQGQSPLGAIYFWGTLLGALFSVCRKREMLHVACK